MAERKQGPVKPPTIDGTAREATAETAKPPRRPGGRKPAAEPLEAQGPAVETEAVTAADAEGVPAPEPIPPRPPTPPEPPRLAPTVAESPSWGLLGTAALAGALLGTALTYGLATLVPLPARPAPDLAPELTAQADRLATIEDRLAAAEAGTMDARTALDDAAGDSAARLTALEAGIAELRTVEPADTSAIEARLRTLTSRVDAIAAGASSADAGAMADNIGDLEQALAALQSEVEALAARSGAADSALGTLEGEVAALKTEVEAAAAEPEPEPQPAGIPIVLSTLESAFATGRPYATALAALQAEDPSIAVDEVLLLHAGTGLVRPDVLDRQFAAAVPLMLEARPASGGGWEQAASDLVSSLLAIRPAAETEGDSPEAVISRLEGAMARHDYAAARDLFAALPPGMAGAAGTVPADIAAHAAAAQLVADLRSRTTPP